MHTLLIDTAALDSESWTGALRAGRLPALQRALRMAEAVAPDRLRGRIAPGPPAKGGEDGASAGEDARLEAAQAAWLSPAERWMRCALGLDGARMSLIAQQAPWGALAAAGAGLDPGTHAWALALPAHLVLGRDSVHLADPAQLSLEAEQAQALLDAVLPLLREQDWRAWVLRPGCWLLSHPSLEHVRSADPLRAVGRNAASWMPGGDAAAPWRRLLTEIQMTWLDHPVNDSRRAGGRPEVNTLWLHGCGALAALPNNPFVLDASEVKAWREASCAWLGALAGALPALPASRHPHPLHVLQLSPQAAARVDEACAELDHAVDARLRAALREHAAVRMVLAGERAWADLELRAARSWHFWRGAGARALLERL